MSFLSSAWVLVPLGGSGPSSSPFLFPAALTHPGLGSGTVCSHCTQITCLAWYWTYGGVYTDFARCFAFSCVWTVSHPQAVESSNGDIFRYHPWRAPGSAPVTDACELALLQAIASYRKLSHPARASCEINGQNQAKVKSVHMLHHQSQCLQHCLLPSTRIRPPTRSLARRRHGGRHNSKVRRPGTHFLL